MNRPDQFDHIMEELLGERFKDYEASFSQDYYRGIRLNPLKASDDSKWLAKLTEDKKSIPWCGLGYYYDEAEAVSKNPLYYGGFYYIQEPSAMSPVEYLDVEPGMKVLDLCAAPGGKSTQIAGYLQGEGLVVSNDISTSRAFALLKNLEIFGVANTVVFSEDGEKMAPYFEGYFDRILIDAPCSGEGMFRKNPKMTSDWIDKGPVFYSEIQAHIVRQAVKMLKPGGVMVYSTCTFAEIENEQVIKSLLEHDSSLGLVDIPKEHGFETGTTLKEVARLYPFNLEGEGHFLAKIKKDDSGTVGELPKVDANAYKKALNKKQLESFETFCKAFFGGQPFESLQVKKDNLYNLDISLDAFKGLRAIRTGLLVGSFKRDRFEPSQALASSLSKEDVVKSYDLNEMWMTRYFKGETIQESLEKGWYLVTIDGKGVGLAKSDGKKLKNKFNPSWLMN